LAIDLSSELQSLFRGASDVGLEVRQRSRGDGLVADLLMVDESGSEVFQAGLKDTESDAHPGFDYPWRIDGSTNTVITFVNPSQRETVTYSLFLFFDGQVYTYDGSRLKPGEVKHVDIKELREKQIPDQFGAVIPKRVTEGQAKLVVHSRAGMQDGNRLIGESIMFNSDQKISATMACANCSSEPVDLRLSPSSIDNVAGSNQSISAQVRYLDNSFWTVNIADAIDWVEGNFNVVQVVVVHDPIREVDRFVADLRNPGSTTIGAVFFNCNACNPCTFDRTLASSNLIQVAVRPTVTVTAADVCTDSIRTQLRPTGVNGAFTLTLVSSAGSVTLVNQQNRAGGDHTDSFNVASLPNRTFTSIQATWMVNGQTGTNSRAYSITVLGDYLNTCYNTPRETDFTGATVVAGTATSQCAWSSRQFIASFLDEVNENGSGIDSSGTAIQIEAFCTNPPPTSPAYNGRRYRRPTNLRTSCGNSPTVGVTVAATSLGCGTRVFINGIGCRTVQDTGALAADQIDNYRGVGNSACAGWANLRRRTIRIN
jgi:hypothetical protein